MAGVLRSLLAPALKKLAEDSAPKIILTNRDSHGTVTFLHKEFGWPVLIQEQESYLLPQLKKKKTLI